MIKPLVDNEARTKALAPDQSFIIQAPAGSGKTGLLIQRYLRLLSLVDAPEEIIAITFTRKAAAEMQGRVLDALEMAANGVEPQSSHDKTSYELAIAALQRDQVQEWQLRQNPGRLRIQTIDSLCASLTRQMPILASMGTQPDTLEDAEPLYQQAAINTLAELESGEAWSEAIANLVFHLDNDLPRIKNMIVDMLKKRDQWLAYVIQEHERKDMERAIIRLIEDQLHRVAKGFPHEYENELIEVIQFAAKHLSETNPDNPVVSCISMSSLPTNKESDLKYWRGIAELLLTKSGTWRKQLTVKNGFPPASGNKLEAEERSSKKKQGLAFISKLQERNDLKEGLATISSLPNAQFTDDEWLIVNALCELLKLSAVQLRLIFAERNQMDFIGIAASAVEALGTDDSPTDLALQLDYHIKHLLVDEYQDISVNQYRLLQGLTREWSFDDGRSLFLVGDPMQSIYRFREAEVALFLKTFHEKSFGNIPLETLRLAINFRSESGLVEWVNTSFKSIFPKQDDLIAGGVSYSDAVSFDNTTSSNNVKIYPLYGKAHKKEAQQVISIIQEIQQNYPEDSIALLVRSRSHLLEVVPAIRKTGVLFNAVDLEGLSTQASVQDLLALTRAYLYQADRVAWLACLRAPWCGLSLESMYGLCDDNKDKTLWECINDPELHKNLQKDEQSRLNKFRAIFKNSLAERQRQSIRDAVESLWMQLGGPATLSDKTELENCISYLSLLEPLDQGGTIEDLQELIDKVSQLYAAPDARADKCLQLMTIHKAKGLEFDHVILPGLGRSPRLNQAELLAWLLRTHGDEEDLILAPIHEAGAEKTAIYKHIDDIDKTKQRFEDARLLYVATTRTRKTLHLLGHASVKDNKDGISCEPQGRSLLAHLWATVNPAFEKHLPEAPEQDEAELSITVNQETKRLTKEWVLPELPAKLQWQHSILDGPEEEPVLIEFEWAGETIKHIGSVVHSAIQWIAEEGLYKWSDERINAESKSFDYALRHLGVPESERPNAVKRVITALTTMLNDERGLWILSNKHTEQKNEYEISGTIEGKVKNLKLDRTFIDENSIRWIIDYKTSPHEGKDVEAFLDQQQERYQDQLNKYGLLMNGLGKNDIKLGLYFPLLQGWREWRYKE